VPWRADIERVRGNLLEAARPHTTPISELSEAALKEMERRYFMHRSEIAPQVFWRLTDNWLEMAVRFVTKEFGTRRIKDRMSREILGAFDEAGLEIASATYDVVGMPPIRVEMQPPAPH